MTQSCQIKQRYIESNTGGVQDLKHSLTRLPYLVLPPVLDSIYLIFKLLSNLKIMKNRGHCHFKNVQDITFLLFTSYFIKS